MRTLPLLLCALLAATACGAGTDAGVDLGPAGTTATAPPAPGTTDAPASAVQTIAATVVRVIDGDTAEMRTPGGTVEDVRFIGVDTPESTTRHEPYGAEASAYTKQRLDGRGVFLELDVEERDRYGRLLAYVWLSRPTSGSPGEVRAEMFNAHLLGDGYAQLLTIPPNVKYVDALRPLQTEAREAGRGLWGIEPEGASDGDCHPSYPDVCIPPTPPDLDCPQVEHRRFRVTGADPHGFDGNGDGVGCEG